MRDASGEGGRGGEAGPGLTRAELSSGSCMEAASMRITWSIALSLTVLMGLPAVAQNGDWPQFRGPGGGGVSSETRLPVDWGPEKNLAWKLAIPGTGWSSPIVWGNRVFVTPAVTDNQPRPAPFPGGPGPGGPPGGPRPGAPGQPGRPPGAQPPAPGGPRPPGQGAGPG